MYDSYMLMLGPTNIWIYDVIRLWLQKLVYLTSATRCESQHLICFLKQQKPFTKGEGILKCHPYCFQKNAVSV